MKMSFFGIGNQKKPVDVSVNHASPAARDKHPDQPAEQPAEQIRTGALIVSRRLTQATARVADLEVRLLGTRKTVEDLNARLTAAREAAIEAATRGEEPPSIPDLEVELRKARERGRIFEEALVRAKVLLQDAEAENLRAAQLEQNRKFAKTLKELMGHAAKMAECHRHLGELHRAAEGRYPHPLLWQAFNAEDYAGWLCAANAFLNQAREPQDERVPAKAAGVLDTQGAIPG
jgi:hypothetical protein